MYILLRPPHLNVCSIRWPWLLHHIAKEYRDSPEGKDTDVLAVNIVQVIYLALRLVTDVRFISIKSRCESQLP